MTDELSSEFLAFSEMLDDEEALRESPKSLSETGTLMLELRRELRSAAGTPPLSASFARDTSRVVLDRMAALSPMARGLMGWEPVVRAKAFSRASAPWLFGVATVGLSVLNVSREAFGVLSGALLAVAAVVAALYARYLPLQLDLSEPVAERVASSAWNRLFYLVPLLAVLTTAGLAGEGVASLAEVSLSFQSSKANLKLAGLATCLVVSVWLYNACYPLWRACERASRGRWLRTLVFQILHCVWFDVALAFWDEARNGSRHLWFGPHLWPDIMLSTATITLLLTWPLSWRTRDPESKTRLWTGVKRSFAGFLIGAVPFVGCLALFYQASLTREMVVEPQYQTMRRDVEAWLSEQKTIEPHQNGYIELRAILRGENYPGVPDAAIAKRLMQGSVLLEALDNSARENQEQDVETLLQARREFLQGLSRIESAVAKPRFSYVVDSEFSLDTQVPDFIVCRAVSQGVEALVRENLDAGQTATALRYLQLNLRWSTKVREGVLINLMIAVAQARIAVDSVQKIVFESELSTGQLGELRTTLRQVAFDRGDFQEAMLRDAYAVDRTFRERLLAGQGAGADFTEGGGLGRRLARLVPRSYWESERLAFLNLQLGQWGNWTDLAAPAELNVAELLPFSIAAQGLVPSGKRAQVQFMTSLSQFAALDLVLALELYKKERGGYPKTLQALMPDYLDEIPVDPMHPHLWNKKQGFLYQKSGEGYRLISESPLYDIIKMPTPQVYGPDGDYKLD